MDFRVELSDQAQRDIAAIFDCFARSRPETQASAGLQRFEQLSRRSPAFPRVARWHAKTETRRLKCVNCCTEIDRTSIEFCLRSTA